VIAGAAQATFDSRDFHSVWDGVWWATVTVATVGYGDLYPTSVQGRLIGILVMIFGIGFLSAVTATIASWLVKTERSGETDAILTVLARSELCGPAAARGTEAGSPWLWLVSERRAWSELRLTASESDWGPVRNR
jgi:hypothetical protein